MKVLIVNFSDKQGGAARAAFRLHEALIEHGIESIMLVAEKNSNRVDVIGPKTLKMKVRNKIAVLKDGFATYKYKNKSNAPFSVAKFGFSSVVNQINEINPDIVHFHWVNAGMLPIKDYAKIKQPIVWSLHDMWAFTGGCHYDDACGEFARSCGNCKVLNSKKNKDLSSKIFNIKRKTFDKINNLTIVGLSSWLTESAKSSTLLKEYNVVNLPNTIDTNKFRPIDKAIARNLLGLGDGKIILFGAMNSTSDNRKGFIELTKALNKIKSKAKITVYGSDFVESPLNNRFDVSYLGQYHDDLSLTLLYSAVDIIVVPSLQENLSNVIMEAMSCGTPVVAFDIGGNKDMIKHKENGYLAKAINTDDLANGIDWTLSNEHNDKLSERARDYIVSNFQYKSVAKKYIQLYKHIIFE